MYSEDLKNSYPIFDTHSHYEDERYNDIRADLFAEMNQNGVCGIVTCGCDEASSKAALKMAEENDFVYAAVGIHPGSIDSGTTPEQIKALATHKKCVAIGEIGLDYYWSTEHKENQKKLFEQQLILANSLSLPAIIHDREAHSDTLELVKKHKPTGVMHCFSGSTQMAEEIVKLGMYIGIGGVVTFKNSKKIQEVVAATPLDRILLETDAPYLAPEPFRGKLNHSALIKHVAEKVAEIKGVSAEEVLSQNLKNVKTLFNV